MDALSSAGWSWYGQPMYQFKVSACIHYEDMKGDAK